jgi:hypothetical protein
MQSGLMRVFLLAITISLLALAAPSLAQKSKAPVWYQTASVTRVKKPDRKVKTPLPKKQTVSLLTLQWRLVERGDGNVKLDADSEKQFRTKDQVQMAVTPNQDGYLYVIHYMEGQDGQFFFPAPHINDGKNFVKKDKEYFVPSRCSHIAEEDDCWLTMEPPAGTENFIVIFSRNPITTLPEQVEAPGAAPVKGEIIKKLETESGQKVEEIKNPPKIRALVPVRYAKWVRNTSTKDNEELITTIRIKHVDRLVERSYKLYEISNKNIDLCAHGGAIYSNIVRSKK